MSERRMFLHELKLAELEERISKLEKEKEKEKPTPVKEPADPGHEDARN